jgi:hypothetical protein
MQTKTKLLGVVGASSMFLASNIFALTTTLDLGPNGDRDPNAWGGEFTAFVSGGANYAANYSSLTKETVDGQTGFETFCVEIAEDFTPGGTYNTTIAQNIQPGGAAITVGTAYLYSQFAQGILADYTYTSGTAREISADELQDAIWYLQGELNSSTESYVQNTSGPFHPGYDGGNYLYSFSVSTDPFIGMVESMFGTNAFASDINDNYGVQVLELSCSSGPAQDQLVYCPVPEPATFAAGAMLLLPLGVSAVRALRKKS